jgi:hypothetical protein
VFEEESLAEDCREGNRRGGSCRDESVEKEAVGRNL